MITVEGFDLSKMSLKVGLALDVDGVAEVVVVAHLVAIDDSLCIRGKPEAHRDIEYNVPNYFSGN